MVVGGPPALWLVKTHRCHMPHKPRNPPNKRIQLNHSGPNHYEYLRNKEQFIYNCEQLLTAGLSMNFFERRKYHYTNERSLIEKLSGPLSLKKIYDLKHHDNLCLT